MIVEGHPDIEHWGRRLMASISENETEPKNCSEPGMFLSFFSCKLLSSFFVFFMERDHLMFWFQNKGGTILLILEIIPALLINIVKIKGEGNIAAAAGTYSGEGACALGPFLHNAPSALFFYFKYVFGGLPINNLNK